MKKITLNESDFLMIVNKVLNEQEDRQFDEDEIDILRHIFKRELKPPFRNDENSKFNYINRDGEYIGFLDLKNVFWFTEGPFWPDFEYKVCYVFGFSRDTLGWWFEIKPHLKSWMEEQLNTELDGLVP